MCMLERMVTGDDNFLKTFVWLEDENNNNKP